MTGAKDQRGKTCILSVYLIVNHSEILGFM